MKAFEIAGMKVPVGHRKDLKIRISEFYTATPVFIPVTVIHGSNSGGQTLLMSVPGRRLARSGAVQFRGRAGVRRCKYVERHPPAGAEQSSAIQLRIVRPGNLSIVRTDESPRW